MAKLNVALKLPAAGTMARERLLALVAEHRKRTYEPLHLAIYFPHPRHKKDVCLFEVLGGFGDGRVDPKCAIFEVQFSSNPSFPMPENKDLRLFLTSPEELREAVASGWASLTAVRNALQSGQADVLFQDKLGAELLGLMR